MDRETFIQKYANIFEHSPWIPDRAYGLPGDDLHANFMSVLNAATDAEKLDLIRAHPELAARVALTDSSTAEQQGAGLRALTEEEFQKFFALNAAYREKFGFPFVICVRRHTKSSILAAFESRLQNDAATEQATALREIADIAKLRLDAMP
jgi:2-oxo-4-hydroxy-4-carboxy-5-ureidoimidazoline decarboxylase